MENIETQGLKNQKVEELLEDRNVDVFDLVMLNGPIDVVKQSLNVIKYHGNGLQKIYQSFFHFYSIEKIPCFLEFVIWCANNYSL